jgi:hypothetical protein
MESDGGDPKAKARTETRDYVWKHWAFHAEQRLRTFHFFILVATVLVAGIFAYIKDARNPAYVSPLGFLLALTCFLFWRIDCRNRVFIKHAEEILKAIERDIPAELVPAERQLFVQEEVKTDASLQAQRAVSFWRPDRWWNYPLSFYHSFSLVFLFFGLLGVTIGVGAPFLPGQPPPANPPFPQQNFYLGSQPHNPTPGPTP